MFLLIGLVALKKIGSVQNPTQTTKCAVNAVGRETVLPSPKFILTPLSPPNYSQLRSTKYLTTLTSKPSVRRQLDHWDLSVTEPRSPTVLSRSKCSSNNFRGTWGSATSLVKFQVQLDDSRSLANKSWISQHFWLGIISRFTMWANTWHHWKTNPYHLFKPALGLMSEDVQSTVWSLKYFLKESWFQLATFEGTTPKKGCTTVLHHLFILPNTASFPPLLQLYKIEQEPLESTS